MLRLKGEGVCGGVVRGHVNFKGDAQSSSQGASMRPMAISVDHLSNIVFVFGGAPTPEEMNELFREGGGLLSQNAFVLEQCTYSLARLLSENGSSGVAGIPPDYFKSGDVVVVNGREGTVEMEGVCAREVVSCLVQSEGKTLILKRSESVGSWQGKWASVSGYIEEGETPTDTAFKEIREELSVESPNLVRKGRPVVTRKEGIVWISHPFLFALSPSEREIRIDWEHTDFRWVTLDELPSFDTVPGLGRTLSALGLV